MEGRKGNERQREREREREVNATQVKSVNIDKPYDDPDVGNRRQGLKSSYYIHIFGYKNKLWSQ